MRYSEWKNVKLSDIADITMGQSPKSEFYNNEGIGIEFLQGNRTFGRIYPDYDTWCTKPSRIAEEGSVLMSVRAPVGDLNIANKRVCIGRGLCSLNMKKNNNMFLYYLLEYNKRNMINNQTGTIFGSINKSFIESMQVRIPKSILEQEKIMETLSTIDYKIELNNKINNNLEELAQTLYKHWFVDFEFPNEEGLPYKSSGGKMIESELGNIPEGWIIYNQGDFSPVITGKKNANIATSNGDYKFFTCGQEPLLTDDFSFDAEAILVAGNGDFNVKYYRGKFEAYQRTYVLIPHISKLTPLLYFSIKNNLNEITKGHRGSVIKFITKGDLENFKLALPIKEKLLALSSVFTTILNKITTIKEENEKLANIRDLLLPKLMSGEIRVPVEE